MRRKRVFLLKIRLLPAIYSVHLLFFNRQLPLLILVRFMDRKLWKKLPKNLARARQSFLRQTLPKQISFKVNFTTHRIETLWMKEYEWKALIQVHNCLNYLLYLLYSVISTCWRKQLLIDKKVYTYLMLKVISSICFFGLSCISTIT